MSGLSTVSGSYCGDNSYVLFLEFASQLFQQKFAMHFVEQIIEVICFILKKGTCSLYLQELHTTHSIWLKPANLDKFLFITEELSLVIL